MLSLKAFAENYAVSSGTAYRHIQQGHLRSHVLNGHRRIDPEDAEQWLAKQPWRARVRNLSRPEMPPVVLEEGDVRALIRCGRGYSAEYVHARAKMGWRVERLRGHGFAIERGWRSGLEPYYRLLDVVEIGSEPHLNRVGPHPDLTN